MVLLHRKNNGTVENEKIKIIRNDPDRPVDPISDILGIFNFFAKQVGFDLV